MAVHQSSPAIPLGVRLWPGTRVAVTITMNLVALNSRDLPSHTSGGFWQRAFLQEARGRIRSARLSQLPVAAAQRWHFLAWSSTVQSPPLSPSTQSSLLYVTSAGHLLLRTPDLPLIKYDLVLSDYFCKGPVSKQSPSGWA